jgi:dCTP deaminase
MALSDKRILEEMKLGNIVIDPFLRSHLSTSSYDVTLGEYYFREHRTNDPIYNIWDEDEVLQVWGREAERAMTANELFGSRARKNIHPTDRVILVAPGETILSHTPEFIGGKNHITSMMKARSSMGRSFIEVCKCAGWGDVGFFNRWTMEITNNSRDKTIPLVVGRRIAQIVFFETGEIMEANYAEGGKYQNSTDLVILKRDWQPHLMLPRLHKDVTTANK